MTAPACHSQLNYQGMLKLAKIILGVTYDLEATAAMCDCLLSFV